MPSASVASRRRVDADTCAGGRGAGFSGVELFSVVAQRRAGQVACVRCSSAATRAAARARSRASARSAASRRTHAFRDGVRRVATPPSGVADRARHRRRSVDASVGRQVSRSRRRRSMSARSASRCRASPPSITTDTFGAERELALRAMRPAQARRRGPRRRSSARGSMPAADRLNTGTAFGRGQCRVGATSAANSGAERGVSPRTCRLPRAVTSHDAVAMLARGGAERDQRLERRSRRRPASAAPAGRRRSASEPTGRDRQPRA